MASGRCGTTSGPSPAAPHWDRSPAQDIAGRQHDRLRWRTVRVTAPYLCQKNQSSLRAKHPCPPGSGALQWIRPDTLGEGLVVPLFKGVEHPDVLRRRYRPDLVAPSVIRVESTRVAPGIIEHGSPFVEVDLASATAKCERLDAVAEMLTAAGVPARVQDSETATLWAKMTFLGPLAVLATPLRAHNGRRADPTTRRVAGPRGGNRCGEPRLRRPGGYRGSAAALRQRACGHEVVEAARCRSGSPLGAGRHRRGAAASREAARRRGARRHQLVADLARAGH